jgi:hypothetical protein
MQGQNSGLRQCKKKAKKKAKREKEMQGQNWSSSHGRVRNKKRLGQLGQGYYEYKYLNHLLGRLGQGYYEYKYLDQW